MPKVIESLHAAALDAAGLAPAEFGTAVETENKASRAAHLKAGDEARPRSDAG